MGPDPKFLDDIARVAGGAVNIISSLQQQVRDEVRARVEEVAGRMDLVPRAEFDQAEAMIKKLRLEQDKLEARIAALESQHGTKKPAAKKVKPTGKKAPPPNKPAAKKAAKKKPIKKAGTKK